MFEEALLLQLFCMCVLNGYCNAILSEQDE